MKNEGAHGLSNTARLRRPPRWRDGRDAGLCFTITTAAEGSGVCTHLNLGFLTRRRQPRSLKPFCNENPLSRRSENDISTSYLDPFAAPLYLFAFSLNVSSLILELLLGVRFVFFAARPEIP